MSGDRNNNSQPDPRPSQGVGESGCPRRTRNAENAGSNPAALTKFDLYGPIPGIDNPFIGVPFDASTFRPITTTR